MTTSLRHFLVLAAVLSGAVASADAIQPDGPFENIKVTPAGATWVYSSDGGKTFANAPLPGPPPGISPRRETKVYPYVFKATFNIDDPAKISGLWVRLVEDGAKDPRAAICTDNLTAASGGYWKDLGFCPTLLNTKCVLNDKGVGFARGGTLYIWAPIEGKLKKGKNTLLLGGNVYTYWNGKPAKSIAARLVVAAAQPAKIYNGPILGDFGEDYFTLVCRTQMPADVTVVAGPLAPAGKPVTAVSNSSIWHRVKVTVPRGTRKVRYGLTAKVGAHETRRGPFTVELPDTTKDFRFVAYGNTMGHKYAVAAWRLCSGHMARARPAFLLNTGTPMEHGSWEWGWQPYYFDPSGDLLATIPSFITPGSRDFSGIFNELHYTPAPKGYDHSWTKAVGPVRLIGLNGYHDWSPTGGNYKWLEGVLKTAKEKFIVVLDGFPGYSSGKSSRHLNFFTKQTREQVLPLLGKYKATVMLCSWDPDYERVEPTPDKGCTQIVTGASGKHARSFGRAQHANPFGPSKSKRWKGVPGTHHFCVFDVKGGTLELKVLAVPGDLKTPATRVIDTKIFKAGTR